MSLRSFDTELLDLLPWISVDFLPSSVDPVNASEQPNPGNPVVCTRESQTFGRFLDHFDTGINARAFNTNAVLPCRHCGCNSLKLYVHL